MLCFRFEILSESFNLNENNLEKLTIFVVENMITHPQFMFYYKHFLADNLNYVSQKIYFGKIGFWKIWVLVNV